MTESDAHQHFFVARNNLGIQASFSNAKGRKNYLIPRAETINEKAPLAVESFSMTPEEYHTLMERVEGLYK